MNQTYQNWELCLADGSDAEHAYIEELCKEYAAKSDGRIVYKHLDHNGGISYNTNECYKLATGDYIGLFDQDDILHPSVLYEHNRPEKDGYYTPKLDIEIVQKVLKQKGIGTSTNELMKF